MVDINKLKSESRFNRIYRLNIQVDGRDILIENTKSDPSKDTGNGLKIVFSAYKSIYGGINKMSIQIYNLNESNRLALVKDREEKKFIPFSLEIGYAGISKSNKKTELIFKGTVMTASSSREGVDMVTSIDSYDGGFDFINSYTNKVVKPGADPTKEIIKDMANTEEGKVDKKSNLTRPKVLVGNSTDLIEKSLNPGEIWYIDNEKIYVIKETDVTSGDVPIVSAQTGLISTPTRESKKVTFTTLMNPVIKIGNRVLIDSKTAPHLNGVYKVQTINYVGDNYGSDWNQTVTCEPFSGKRV